MEYFLQSKEKRDKQVGEPWGPRTQMLPQLSFIFSLVSIDQSLFLHREDTLGPSLKSHSVSVRKELNLSPSSS